MHLDVFFSGLRFPHGVRPRQLLCWRRPRRFSTSSDLWLFSPPHHTPPQGGKTYIIDGQIVHFQLPPPTSTSRAMQLKSRLLTHSAHVRQNHVFCQHQCMCTINHVSPSSVHVHPFVLFCRITCWLPAISCCFQPFMSRPGQLVASSKIVKIAKTRQKLLKS